MLVRVEAAGLNPLDEKIRAGEFKQILPYKLPLILGNDVAGTVISVGTAVRGFKPGDEVYARPHQDRIGTFAERIAIAQGYLALKPASISMEEAGSLPLAALTAWQALVERGNVRPGQKVLIHAGAGGVGSIAIQLAAHLGASVATTASGSNADFPARARRGHGDRLPQPGFRAAPDRLRPGAGQPRRGDPREVPAGAQARRQGHRDHRSPGPRVRPRGRPLPAAAPGGRSLSGKIRRQAKKLGETYEFLFMRASGDQLRQITTLVDQGAVRPVVGKVVGFDQTPQALQSLSEGGIRGKAVIGSS